MDHGLEAKLQQVVRKVDTLQTTVDRAIEQLDEDRKDISDIKVAIGKNLAVSEGARDDIHSQTKMVTKQIQESLQPIPDVMSDSVEAGFKKLIPDLKKKKWFLFKRR